MGDRELTCSFWIYCSSVGIRTPSWFTRTQFSNCSSFIGSTTSTTTIRLYTTVSVEPAS